MLVPAQPQFTVTLGAMDINRCVLMTLAATETASITAKFTPHNRKIRASTPRAIEFFARSRRRDEIGWGGLGKRVHPGRGRNTGLN